MDKETFSSYGFLLITTMLIGLLIAIATPVGNVVFADIENKFNVMAQNTGVMEENDDAKYGTIVVHYFYEGSAQEFKTYKTTARVLETCYINFPEIKGYTLADNYNNIIQIQDETVVHLNVYYKPETYVINYILNGGAWDNEETIEMSYQYGQEYILPTTITKEGYHFVGWFKDKGLGGDRVYLISEKDTGNKIFYAKYTIL